MTRGRAQPSQQSREEMVRRLFYDKWACPLQLATNLREGLLLVESAYYCLHSQETMLNRGLNTVSICEIGTLQVKLQSSAKDCWELYLLATVRRGPHEPPPHPRHAGPGHHLVTLSRAVTDIVTVRQTNIASSHPRSPLLTHVSSVTDV